MAKRANEERGEHELVLAGKTYVLRPSVTALKTIERETGVALIALTRAGNTGSMTLEQIGVVSAELIRAGADEDDDLTRGVSAERMSELAYEEGIAAVQAALTMCLVDAVTGGRTASGEARAAPAKKKTAERAGAASQE